jgi:L-amino acid N-acyltransferase YncA
MGFSECGRMNNVGYKHNAWQSIVWMDKDIWLD